MSGVISKLATLVFWIAGAAMSFAAQAVTIPIAPGSNTVFAPIGATTKAPIGWLHLCSAQPAECDGARLTSERVILTAASWAELNQINRLANLNIAPISDEHHYAISRLGILNWWTYPDDGMGNCNDYVLLKRKLLIEAGWPKSALLMTVVRDQSGSGHLVLMVRTDRGDLILDNLKDEIVRWNETDYRFVKRQSETKHSLWISFDGSVALP